MPPSEPPRSSRSRPSRRPRKKPTATPKPRPSSQNAQAYVSQGRAVERAANQQRATARVARVARRSARTAAAGPQAPLPNRPGITSRTGSPAPKPQTAAQQARSARSQHVSQGRQVEQVAHSQQRAAYAAKPLDERRSILRAALKAPNPTRMQRAALELHHERHAGDVAAEHRSGGFLPRELLKLPANVDLRLSSLPEPRGVDLPTVAVNDRQRRALDLENLTADTLDTLDRASHPGRGGGPKPGDPDWQPDQSIAGAAGSNPNPEAKALPGPHKAKFAGSTQVAGITLPGLHQGAWTAGAILNELGRPLHAVAGGLKAEQEGGNVWTAIKRGAQNKDKFTFSDLPSVKSIPNPVVRTIAGIGGDVIGDPLNYVSFGAKVPAQVLVEGAQQAHRLAEEAQAAGHAAKAARYLSTAGRLAARAEKAPATNRGIQIALRPPVGSRGVPAVSTSGAGTARLSDLLQIPAAAKIVRETPVAQGIGRKFIPGFRPAGADPAEWNAALRAEQTARAAARSGTRTAERRGRAYDTAIADASRRLGISSQEAQDRIVAAVERAPHDVETANLVRQAVSGSKGARMTPEFQQRAAAIDHSLLEASQHLLEAGAERARQQRTYEDSLVGTGVARGRAQMLSRNVGGVEAESAAQARTVPAGVPHFQGGGHGVSLANEGLRAAHTNLRRAVAVEKAADANLHRVEREAAQLSKTLKTDAPKIASRHASRAVAGMPSHSIDELPAELRPIAQTFRAEMDRTGQQEVSAGILENVRANYVPHQWADTLETRGIAGSLRQVIGGGRNVFEDRRRIEGSVAEINARRVEQGRPELFSTSVPALAATRMAKSAKALAHRQFQDDLLESGVARQITHPEHARPDQGYYVFGKGGVRALEDSKALPDSRAAEKALAAGERVVAMNRVIGDRYTKGAFNRITTTQGGQQEWRLFDRFLSGMKTAFTVLNVPAYDARNLTGDLFNAYLADTSSRDVLDAAKAMRVQIAKHRAEAELSGSFSTRATVNIGAGRKVSTAEALRRAERSGAIQTGYVGGEKFEVTRATGPDVREGIQLNFAARTTLGSATQTVRPIDRLRAVGQTREDMVRFATWLGAKRRGMSDTDAARWANAHHFDYADLTDAERSLFRRLFPFWTFTARNTALQAKRVLTNPGKYANYEAVREELAKQAGLSPDWEKRLQSYQQRGAGIPFHEPGRKGPVEAFPNLPLTDLSRVGALTSPGDEADLIGQNLNPLVKVPLELWQNRNFFFKAPIHRSPDEPDARHWVPAPPQLAAVPALRHLLGMRKVPDPTNHNRPIWQYTATADYLVRQTPQTNTLAQALTPATGSRGQSSRMSLISQLTGVRLGAYDSGKNQLAAEQQRMRELRVKQQDMQDLGTDRTSGGTAYTHDYRRLLDTIGSTQGRIDKLKAKQGRAPRRKPIRRRKGGGSGIYGAPSGGAVYGAPPTSGIYQGG